MSGLLDDVLPIILICCTPMPISRLLFSMYLIGPEKLAAMFTAATVVIKRLQTEIHRRYQQITFEQSIV